MKKIIANLLTQLNGKFPFSANGLKRMQDNEQLAEILGNIGGNKIIIKGCTNNQGNWSEGYVFIRTIDFPDGEILFCSGGNGNNFYVNKTAISVTSDGVQYPSAYTQRSLDIGLGDEQFDLSTFTVIKPVTQLMSEYNALKETVDAVIPSPIGSIVIWASNNIPKNYMLCDGSLLVKSDYSELYAVLGTLYGEDGNRFGLPNMKDRFVVGKGDTEYTVLGNRDGKSWITLTAEQSGLPSHTHGAGFNLVADGTPGAYADAVMSQSGGTRHPVTTSSAGGTGATDSHDNRPPFIVLNYIIKVK